MAVTKELQDILETLEAAAHRKRYRRIDFFEPYEKQDLFFQLGATKRERLLSAGNQQGKTEAGAFEAACHLTGDYPHWWRGRRWNRPVKGWAAAVTSTDARDGPQKKLCGEAGVEATHGTGYIPLEAFADKPSLGHGVTDGFDTIQVKHKTNGREDGVSVLRFKSYEQGRKKFQSETLDFIWDDEEPPDDIYSEELARISATGGMIFTTFTPLMGMSSVVRRFYSELTEDRGRITMQIEDAKHIPVEDRARIIAGYLPHERDARTRGVPMLGSGRIFTSGEESIMEDAIENVPLYWLKLWGLDFGIGHPFAAVLSYWDRDNDVIHIAYTFRMADQLPLQHAVPMRITAANVPVAWPQDGTVRRDDGKPLADHYKRQNLLMLPEHATFPDGSISTEAGVLEMSDRMATSRLKVAKHLSDWFEEYRLYHRKDGLIVKEHDDIMSATRIAVMAKRFGKAVPLGSQIRKRRQNAVADGIDFPLF